VRLVSTIPITAVETETPKLLAAFTGDYKPNFNLGIIRCVLNACAVDSHVAVYLDACSPSNENADNSWPGTAKHRLKLP